MTQQEKEIIRSYAGGTPVEEIAEVEGVTAEQIAAIIESNPEEVAHQRAFMQEMGWTE